jgi:hypothetical protein
MMALLLHIFQDMHPTSVLHTIFIPSWRILTLAIVFHLGVLEKSSMAFMCDMDEMAAYEVISTPSAAYDAPQFRCQKKSPPPLNQVLSQLELFSSGVAGVPQANVCEAQNIVDFRATIETFYRFSKSKYQEVLKNTAIKNEKDKPQTRLYDAEQGLTTFLTGGKKITSNTIASALQSDQMNMAMLMPSTLQSERIDCVVSAGMSLGGNVANFALDTAGGSIFRSCKRIGGILYACGSKVYHGQSIRNSITETAVHSAVGSLVGEIPFVGPVVDATGDCITIKDALIQSKGKIRSYFYNLAIHLKAAEEVIHERQKEVLKAAQKEQEILTRQNAAFEQAFQERRVSCLCDAFFHLEKTVASFQKRVQDESKKYEKVLTGE